MSRYLTDYCSSNLTLMAKRYASDETKVILMLKELRLIKESKRKKETMATGYYIHGRSAELEAVERWENEGGGLSQTHDYVLDSPGENYLRHKDQAMAIGRLAKRDASNPKSNARWLPIVDSERRLPNWFSRSDYLASSIAR